MSEYGLSSANEILRIARLFKALKVTSAPYYLKYLAEAVEAADKLEALAIDNIECIAELTERAGEVDAVLGQEELHHEHTEGRLSA